MRHPSVRCLSHPKGRIINHRPPNALRLECVLEVALEEGIAIETNGLTSRLDLRDVEVREAIDAGIVIACSTDAHSVPGLENIEVRHLDRATRLGHACRRAQYMRARRRARPAATLTPGQERCPSGPGPPAGIASCPERYSTTMRVLATQRLPGTAWDELTDVEIGSLDVVHADAEALVAPGAPIDDPVLDRLPALRLVANYGVGYDQVDVAACRARRIEVTNTPGVLDAATADLAFALMLAVRRRLVEGDDLVRSGRWGTSWSQAPFLGNEVSGATLGIVGLGRIGGAMARRARGFDMRVVYHQRTRLDEPQIEYRTLDDLLREADVVSIHAPLTPETTGLISRDRLALLRDGATLVNTARGALIDEEALVDELESGRIRAGLDVFADDLRYRRGLFGLPNVVLTPHIGSGHPIEHPRSDDARRRQHPRGGRGEPPLTPV